MITKYHKKDNNQRNIKAKQYKNRQQPDIMSDFTGADRFFSFLNIGHF